MSYPYTTFYSKKSRDDLNINTVPCEKSSEFPRRLYSREPFNVSRPQPFQYMGQTGPTDKDIDYFFNWDRFKHPDYMSRFGYPYCPNGYCMGNMPGKYNTPPCMQWQTQTAMPDDMAPAKYYEGKHMSPFYCSSDAYNDSFIARNYL